MIGDLDLHIGIGHGDPGRTSSGDPLLVHKHRMGTGTIRIFRSHIGPIVRIGGEVHQDTVSIVAVGVEHSNGRIQRAAAFILDVLGRIARQTVRTGCRHIGNVVSIVVVIKEYRDGHIICGHDGRAAGEQLGCAGGGGHQDPGQCIARVGSRCIGQICSRRQMVQGVCGRVCRCCVRSVP